MVDNSIFPHGTTGGEGYDMDRQTRPADVHVHVPETPDARQFRLACLELAAKFDPEAGEGEVMQRAKNFSDFVLTGAMPEYKTDAEKEDEADEAEMEAHLRRRYSTQAFVADEEIDGED